jgi:hypothetical protein
MKWIWGAGTLTRAAKTYHTSRAMIRTADPFGVAVARPVVIAAHLECFAMWSGRALSNTASLPTAG